MEIISRSEAKAQGLTHYYTGKPCKRGHVERRFVSGFQCVVCAKMHYDERRKNNPEAYREAQRKHYANNREKCIAATMESQKKHKSRHLAEKRRDYWNNRERYREYAKRYYRENSEKAIKRSRDYRLNNPEKVRAYFREYLKTRRANDPDFKMRHACAYMVRRVLEKSEGSKANNTEMTLGYSCQELRRHIERNMAPDMSWGNYGDLWQIDHVIPVMEFIKMGCHDPAKINALSNLMPEYKEENQRKGDKFSLSSPPVV